MAKIVVLGATGMLGSAFVDLLGPSNRDMYYSSRMESNPLSNWFYLDASSPELAIESMHLGPGDYVVNCIGVIKSHITESSTESRASAVEVNALFPLKLARLAESMGFRVIQIATDCVFSGRQGWSDENSSHDALDVYGKTKSLGESISENVLNIRTSIIGPERGRSTSLVEWVRNQPLKAEIQGYEDHFWNGVTAHHFAKIVIAIIRNGSFRNGTFHLVPEGFQTKAQLVLAICKRFRREDIKVVGHLTGERIDRRLATLRPEISAEYWTLAGYDRPPTIHEMLAELPDQSSKIDLAPQEN